MKSLGQPPNPHTHSLHQWPCPTRVPAAPPQHQLEVHQEAEQMELDIPDNIPDLLNVLEEVMFDFDAWAKDVLIYQF